MCACFLIQVLAQRCALLRGFCCSHNSTSTPHHSVYDHFIFSWHLFIFCLPTWM
jgi:hypothetical protein